MKIITLSCSDCGTVVAANELEQQRRMQCPGLGCEAVLGFDQLSESDRDFFRENKEKYSM